LNVHRFFQDTIKACLNPDPEKRPNINQLIRMEMFQLSSGNPMALQKKRVSSSQPPKSQTLNLSAGSHGISNHARQVVKQNQIITMPGQKISEFYNDCF
jgi:serine/threonine protein kinase